MTIVGMTMVSVFPKGVTQVGRMDVVFLPGATPAGSFVEPSVDLVNEKPYFGLRRKVWWFGL